MSAEDASRLLDQKIQTHGFAIVQVGDGSGRAWSYTIGLVEQFDHPELVMLDVDPDVQAQVIHDVASDIKRLGYRPYWRLKANGLTCVEVHPDHLDGNLFVAWSNRYGHTPEPGDVVQLVLPPECFCPEHAAKVTRLDRARPKRAPLQGPNRAERRRRDRQRRQAS